MAVMDSRQAPQPEVASYAPGLLLLAPHRHQRARPKWKDPLLISKGYPGEIPISLTYPCKICRKSLIYLAGFFGSHPKKMFKHRPHILPGLNCLASHPRSQPHDGHSASSAGPEALVNQMAPVTPTMMELSRLLGVKIFEVQDGNATLG